jgi:hypothetical protein
MIHGTEVPGAGKMSIRAALSRLRHGIGGSITDRPLGNDTFIGLKEGDR